MPRSAPFEGFSLGYDRIGSGPAVILLNGWPGDRHDYDLLVPQLSDRAEVIPVDLRGYGESDKHSDVAGSENMENWYGVVGEAGAIIHLIGELGLSNVILGGYDVGSFVAQTVASLRPDLVKGLVVSPPLPGAGRRILEVEPVRVYWYSSFIRTPLAEELLDGKSEAVRPFLHYLISYWSGPNHVVDEARINHLTEIYSQPGTFIGGSGHYRTNWNNPVTFYANETTPPKDKRITTPTSILWAEFDPCFPLSWADRLDDFFTDCKMETLKGCGHFTPIEAPDRWAVAVKEHLARQ
jgi:pimeloyl-ACP methyl ester carboxylesterase